MELVVDTLSALGQSNRQAGKEAAVAGGQAPLREAAVRRKGQKRQLSFMYELHGGVIVTLSEILLCFPRVKGDLGSGNHEESSGV